MTRLDKDDAECIAKKLDADIKPKAKHDIAYIKCDGTLVGHFGIRRGSKSDLDHTYLAGQIHLSVREAKRMASCSMSKQEYVDKMVSDGVVKRL